jgi:hypothetical protein
MNARIFLPPLVLLLAACGQQPTETARPPEAPAPVEVAQSTGGACPVGRASGGALQSQGSAAGHEILSTTGAVACSEPGLEGRVECAVTGPAEIQITGATGETFSLAAGQTGTLIVGADGASCHLNASGE